MKIILIALSAVALSAASCSKENNPISDVLQNKKEETDTNLCRESPCVQVYFHIKRIAKIHIKLLKDEYGKEYPEEIIDEITDRLYIRYVGYSKGYKVLYDLEVTANDKIPQILVNKESTISCNLNENIMCINNNIFEYYDPVPEINVKRFVAQKIAETNTKEVIYNPLLNSYELVKLSY